MPRTSDKRERLVQAAKQLLYQQGFNQTSLADIASLSGVPLGNVYYYFRTKNDIARAVMSDFGCFCSSKLAWIELEAKSPIERIMLMMELVLAEDEDKGGVGCPIYSLCEELNRARSELSAQANELVEHQILWVTEQFEAMNKPDAESLARYLISTLCGTSSMAKIGYDKRLIENQIEHIRAWLLSI